VIRRAAALALLPLLTACASTSSSATSSSQGSNLEGTTWVLTTRLGGMADSGSAKAQIDIRLEAGQASGSSGCNHYGGPYTLQGSSLSFGPLASTAMACPEPIMTIESQYLQALAKVDGYTVSSDGKSLTLTGPDVELAFKAEAPVADLPLTGTAWRLTTIGGANGTVSSTLAGTEVDAVFAADGTVAGTDGCNRYHATFTAGENGAMSIGPVAATKMACAQDVMDQANAFTAGLGATASSTIDGMTLTLSDAGGALLLAFDGTAGAA
jgi:heat shock protein HslJ